MTQVFHCPYFHPSMLCCHSYATAIMEPNSLESSLLSAPCLLFCLINIAKLSSHQSTRHGDYFPLILECLCLFYCCLYALCHQGANNKCKLHIYIYIIYPIYCWYIHMKCHNEKLLKSIRVVVIIGNNIM